MNEESKYCVYVHINKVNNKKYVGITMQKPEKRWGKNGYCYRDSPVFYGAIQMYGWNNFEHKILESGLSYSEAELKERMYINQFDSTSRDCGYNILAGGNVSCPEGWTDEMRKRHSKILTPLNGTPERREAMSKRIKKFYAEGGFSGRTRYSDEGKKKLSIARRGERASMFGKKGSDCPSSKPVDQYSVNHEYIKTWPCGVEAEQQLGVPCGHIGEVCIGRNNANTAGGFYWAFHGEVPLFLVHKKARPIAQIDKNTRELVELFPSKTEAKKKTGLTPYPNRVPLKMERVKFLWYYVDAYSVAGHIIDKQTFQEVGIAEAASLLILPETLNKPSDLKENK